MKPTLPISILSLAMIAVLFSGCDKTPRFKVEGKIKDASNRSLILERPGFHGEWAAVDSTVTDDSGKFSIKAPRPAAPEIYRLRMADRYVYFPVDSTESIGVDASLAQFGHIYSLSGSNQAERLAEFENDFARFAAAPASTDSTAAFKRHIYTRYIQVAPASVVSYHILTKTMADGTPFFDFAGSDDYRYLAAVANGYKAMRPEDPHTAMLEGYAVEAIRIRNREKGMRTELRAKEISLLPIVLTDEKGESRSLAEVAGKGAPVILVFAPLTDPEAAARNRDILNTSSAHGAKVFHVSFDRDQYQWREAASNLPWITVNDPSARPQSIIDYNLGSLPIYYLIDSNGELVKRGDTLSELF